MLPEDSEQSARSPLSGEVTGLLEAKVSFGNLQIAQFYTVMACGPIWCFALTSLVVLSASAAFSIYEVGIVIEAGKPFF